MTEVYVKLLLGRIMQYGYQGNLSTSWRSQNDSDADKLAHAFATQLLVWETVVGERDSDFDHVSTGGYDEILSLVSPNHPLYSRIMDYYDSIESSVQSHAVCPSFMSRSSGGAKTIELAWDGSQYIAELTDTNRVLSQFTFSASETGFHFSVSGNTLTITTDTAPSGNVTISASRSASRCGVLVWTDYKYGPNGGVQDSKIVVQVFRQGKLFQRAYNGNMAVCNSQLIRISRCFVNSHSPQCPKASRVPH